jgi:hypothetical protein
VPDVLFATMNPDKSRFKTFGKLDSLRLEAATREIGKRERIRIEGQRTA